jgi:hypothetical protein
MSKAKAQPRALIHQNILDKAENHPDASIEELATDVGGATPDLVERVLDEYGDPCKVDSEQTSENQQSEEDDAQKLPTVEDLTRPQRNILQAIREQPSATQRELGDRLGVSDATICSHVNSIDGFEWTDRKNFVKTLISSTDIELEGEHMTPNYENGQEDRGDRESLTNKTNDEIPEQRERLAHIEKQLEEIQADQKPVFDDSELTHKVIHACMKSDAIIEEEELQIIEDLI